MSIFIKLYLIIWIILTVIWIILLIKNRKTILLFKGEYGLFLMKKWKIILFLVATFLLSYISTLWYDPTWDIPETIIMSVLTYYTAPYSVGVIYRYFSGLYKNGSELYIAFILILFSSAWFYDIYAMIFLVWTYPLTAFSNLWLSPFFYIFAWMMWSLDYKKELWVIFVYKYKEWTSFVWDVGNFQKISIYILPIALFMMTIFGYFIYLNQ